jgi:hypothetical protein
MSVNALLFALVGGILTFLSSGEFSELVVTNIFLGLIAGKLMDKK